MPSPPGAPPPPRPAGLVPRRTSGLPAPGAPCLLAAPAGLNKAQAAPTLASASNHSAFNLANAGGAWLGGVAVSAGWGWTSPSLVGAVLAAVGLGIAVLAGVLDRSGRGSRVVARGAGGRARTRV